MEIVRATDCKRKHHSQGLNAERARLGLAPFPFSLQEQDYKVRTRWIAQVCDFSTLHIPFLATKYLKFPHSFSSHGNVETNLNTPTGKQRKFARNTSENEERIDL